MEDFNFKEIGKLNVNLNEMEKDVMKKYSDKLAFFESKAPVQSIADKNDYWHGDDYHKFFDIAVKADIKMIYYYKFTGNNNNIEELDFGFMHDGIMHILIAYTKPHTTYM